MKILEIGKIVELNHALREAGIACQVHLCDRCSGQYFRLDQTEDVEDAILWIRHYFAEDDIVFYETDGFRFSS
jgi:hypothetical protein